MGQAFKVMSIIFIIILSIIGAFVGGIVGMFVGATTFPLKILNGRATKSQNIVTDIINGDIDRI